MLESGRVLGKGGFRANIEKLSRRVPEKGRISVSTEKWKNAAEYPTKVESVRVLKSCPGEYQKRVNHCEDRKLVESGGVPGKGRIRASIKKLFGRVQKKGSISVSTGKWSNPGDYREKVQSE